MAYTKRRVRQHIPVLFLVELSTGRIHYVCLNDWIEKVVLPRDPSYDGKQSRTIHIPARNCIIPGDTLSLRPLETYAKRAKLYAAFEKFAYQQHELEIALAAYETASSQAAERNAAREMLALTKHFLSVTLRYDFWTRMPEWKPIRWAHRELAALEHFVEPPGRVEEIARVRAYLVDQPWLPLRKDYVMSLSLAEAQHHVFSHIVAVWDRLVNLSRMYEELVREWFLPTELAMQMGEDLRAVGRGDPAER